MTRSLRLAAFLAASALAPLGAQQPAGGDDTGSENPPPGAPWMRDFLAAQKEAAAARKPIFVYSTKTH